MPDKQRHSHRRKIQREVKDKASVVSGPGQETAADRSVRMQASPQPRAAAPANQALAMRMTQNYPYIGAELKRTGILAAAVLIVLIVLYFALP